MECPSEIVKLTKIRDGIFIGDSSTASNLDVVVHFKITHMINTSGGELLNTWKCLGLKYLTFKWSEGVKQNLFDSKDEIADIIVEYIDHACDKGEGLLIHSVKGNNRACIAIIIYLMKKYIIYNLDICGLFRSPLNF